MHVIYMYHIQKKNYLFLFLLLGMLFYIFFAPNHEYVMPISNSNSNARLTCILDMIENHGTNEMELGDILKAKSLYEPTLTGKTIMLPTRKTLYCNHRIKHETAGNIELNPLPIYQFQILL